MTLVLRAFSVSLALLITAGCDGNSAAPAAPSTDMLGGWDDAGVDEEMTREAAEFAASALARDGAQLKSIDAARSQVVAGIQFDLTLTLTDNSRWQVTAWFTPQGEWKLSDATAL